MPEEEVLLPLSRLHWLDYLEGSAFNFIFLIFYDPDALPSRKTGHIQLHLVTSVHFHGVIHFPNHWKSSYFLTAMLAGAIFGPTSPVDQVWQCWWCGETSFFALWFLYNGLIIYPNRPLWILESLLDIRNLVKTIRFEVETYPEFKRNLVFKVVKILIFSKKST